MSLRRSIAPASSRRRSETLSTPPSSGKAWSGYRQVTRTSMQEEADRAKDLADKRQARHSASMPRGATEIPRPKP